jgi:hypothetical protein
MKSIISVFAVFAVIYPAVGAAPVMTPATGRGRVSMSNQMMSASRAVASKNQISGLAQQGETVKSASVDTSMSHQSETIKDKNTGTDDKLAVTPDPMLPGDKDMREREKRACLQNNIGIGNTFVWASRYSNLGNYSTMIEDLEEPENNTCFVKVELKSDDAKIGVADIPSKYFEMGHNITCGEWADYDTLKSRILDAKKSARTWATVGGVVGGAGIGVGAMELFGNKLIGGAVQGQKSLKGLELLKSQLAVLEQDDKKKYDSFMSTLAELKCACESHENANERTECKNYKEAFSLIKNSNCDKDSNNPQK